MRKAIYFILTIIFFSGCEMIKSVSKTKEATQNVSKIDSGSVKYSAETQRDEQEWWREWVTINQPQGDNQSGKESTPNVTNVYPSTTIYREGGRLSQEESLLNSESYWRNKYDSAVAVKTESVKDVKTTVMDPWQIIAITVGIVIGLWILQKLLFRVKISFK